jgi:NADH:ubiquinone oxidoreductase subunit H
MGAIQRRRGPNVVGFMGLLQPLADGLKLFAKETTIPTSADTNVFFISAGSSICFEFTWLGHSFLGRYRTRGS